jgi:DHA1 family bicyclomycin/chloramphenicol resistance-like MFS transporter
VRARTPPTAALALVAAAGPFSTDAYVAALPAMQSSLHTSAAGTQLTATTCIIGLAAGMSLSGPLSDARGRRVFLVGGAVAYLLCSAVCALAPNGPVLIVGRLLQGLAAGCAAPISRAVITDRFGPDEAARRIASLTSVALLAPVLAPAVGGALLIIASWRAVFWMMAALGAAMVVTVLAVVPESLPVERRQPTGLRDYGHRVRDLLTDRGYLTPLAIQCLAIPGLFVYVGGSPFVLQDGLGVTPGLYSAVFATDAIAMVLASAAFRLAVTRYGAQRLRTVGLCISAASGAALLVAAATSGQDTPLTIVWALLATALAGMGLTVPAASVLAQQAGARSAGTAASLFNGIGYLAAALAAPLTGWIDGRSLLVMATLMAGLFALALFGERSRGSSQAFLDPAGHRDPTSPEPCSESS